MLTLNKIYDHQVKYGAVTTVSNTERVSYESFLLSCRQMLSDKTPAEYHNWDRKKQNDFDDNLIMNFVKDNLKDVEGFIDENGQVKQGELMDKLRTDIIYAGILKEALEFDDSIQEIRINDAKTIWVVRGGKSELYTDPLGRPYQFVNDLELRTAIDRLIQNRDGTTPRMTETHPLINARTAKKGYRVSAVHSSATTPDMTKGFDFPVTNATIRKYAPSMLTFEDFVEFGSMTPEMANFLKLCGRANVRLFCVGPTDSGKTTLLNAICWEIPRNNRIILIQNPTEIMIYERSLETGANLRDVLHWEAADIDARFENDPNVKSMANLVAHSLRNNPDVVVPGEVRTPGEIQQALRVAKTGHRLLSSIHAGGPKDMASRIADELSQINRGSPSNYIQSVANQIDIAVTQVKLNDGRRLVTDISECTGRIEDDGTISVNKLFGFTYTGKTTRGAGGKIERIHGYFEQRDPISSRLKQKFFEAGISEDELYTVLHPNKVIEGSSNLESQIGVQP